MHTENLTHFQYTNAATSYYVSATEYHHGDGSVSFRVSYSDDGEIRVAKPETRAGAVKLAETLIANFVREMAATYL